MSYKVEVLPSKLDKWVSNSLRFNTEKEAESYAVHLINRWTAVRETRVVQSTDEVNFSWGDPSDTATKPT